VRGWRRAFLDSGEDRVLHDVHLPKDLVVPEADDTVSEARQMSLARRVPRAVAVLGSVDLDHEFRGAAAEIGEVRTQRLLALEFVPGQPSVAQFMPKPPLGVGHRTP
jgi:hypothetical protein